MDNAQNEQLPWPAKLKQDFYGMLLGRRDAPDAVLIRYVSSALWSRVLGIGRDFSLLRPLEVTQLQHFYVHGLRRPDLGWFWLDRDTRSKESLNADGIIFINYLSVSVVHRACDLMRTRTKRRWRLFVSVPPHESIGEWVACLSNAGSKTFSNWELDLPSSPLMSPPPSQDAVALQRFAFELGVVLIDDAAEFLAQHIRLSKGSLEDKAQAVIFRIRTYLDTGSAPLTKSTIDCLFQKKLAGFMDETDLPLLQL